MNQFEIGSVQSFGEMGCNRRDILQGGGFHVSYLHPGQAMSAADGGTTGETALVRDGQYYILNGHHFEQYRERIHSWAMCITYFLEHQDELSGWSDRYEG